MSETQIELTPDEEARIKWEQLLRGKSQPVAEETIEEAVEKAEELPVVTVVDTSPEAVLANLYKSMIKE